MLIDLLEIFIIVFLYAFFWFIVSIIKKRNDVADIAWGLGYILLSVYTLLTNPLSSRGILICILVILWGMRLAVHISYRNKGKSEDIRYKQWRDEWDKFFYVRSFFQIYLLQGLAMIMIWSPVFIVFHNKQSSLGPLDYLALMVWVTGFFFESVGDFQLLKFLKNPDNQGNIMDRGVWRFTRHPNYFGEVTMWWGIFILMLSSENGIFAIISPITITYLLLFVSGIPMLEKRYEGNPSYEAYKKKTSPFIPMPPRKQD